MTPTFSITDKLNVALVQFVLSKAVVDALPKSIARKPDQTAEDRAKQQKLPETERAFHQRGVSGKPLPFVLRSAKLQLCEAYVQLRTGKDPETSEDRVYGLLTFVFGKKPNDDKKRRNELEAGDVQKESERLLNRRWADVNVFKHSSIENSPAVSIVFSGEGDPLEDSDLLPDQDALSWGIQVTRIKKKE